tara:strand:- start:29 stop:829 length:801 start_codon:yes stop_codon:yes gene_type:complete
MATEQRFDPRWKRPIPNMTRNTLYPNADEVKTTEQRIDPLTGNIIVRTENSQAVLNMTRNTLYQNTDEVKTSDTPQNEYQKDIMKLGMKIPEDEEWKDIRQTKQEKNHKPKHEKISLPVIASYYTSIGEFSYDGILSTEIVKGTTIDYVKEREPSINACESRVQQVSREWKINILRIPRVFAHITLGGILSKNVLLSLGSYIKNELFTKQNKIPKYVEITQYNPLLGHSTKIKIIKYTMTDYIPITRAILSWLDLDNNSSQVIYSR